MIVIVCFAKLCFFPINSNAFYCFHELPRYFKTKNRHWATWQGDITISVLMSLKMSASTFVMLTARHHFPIAQRKDNKINC